MSSMKTLKLLTVTAVLVLGGCLSSSEDTKLINDGPAGSTNSSPSIGGTPAASVKIGEMYSFTPSASDADGDALTFSIQNKPGWADFDTSIGKISGVPTQGDVGVYSNISVSVSDGPASSTLPQFSISVDQVGTASTTLSWTAPTQNEDGTALTDLAGYKIYYGKSSRSYTSQIRIDNPGVTTYVVDNLTPDTYYFAATAFNASGIESSFSGEAIKTVN